MSDSPKRIQLDMVCEDGVGMDFLQRYQITGDGKPLGELRVLVLVSAGEDVEVVPSDPEVDPTEIITIPAYEFTIWTKGKPLQMSLPPTDGDVVVRYLMEFFYEWAKTTFPGAELPAFSTVIVHDEPSP